MATPKKKDATTTYKGIRTTYKNGVKITKWEGDYGPKENIANMKNRAKQLSEDKKDTAAANRNKGNATSALKKATPNKKYTNAQSISSKKDTAAVKRNQAAKGEFAGIVAKNAATAAKVPGSASAPTRKGVNASGYNTAFVAAKKDMAAFKRNQGKKKTK